MSVKPSEDDVEKRSSEMGEKSVEDLEAPVVSVTQPIQLVVKEKLSKTSRALCQGTDLRVILLTVLTIMTILTYVQVSKPVKELLVYIDTPHVARNYMPPKAMEFSNQASTGAACISTGTCDSLENGDYQSCTSCDVFASCWDGVFTDNRPCVTGLVWDDLSKRCATVSRTCSNDGTPSTTQSIATPITATFGSGDGVCVSSCAGKADGDYQSCFGCETYATCANGLLYDHRPCPGVLVWDDFKRSCQFESETRFSIGNFRLAQVERFSRQQF